MNAQDKISNICKIVPDFEELFNSRVRHYTINNHTLNVMNQFEKYFSNSFSEIDIELFRLFLLLHDVGKPIAHKNSNRANQNSETIRLISEKKEVLNLSDADFQLFKALLGSDALGLYMQDKLSLEEAFHSIKNQSDETNLDPELFFYLLSVYYQCDVASYTKDAGGIKYLEYLFAYQNGDKMFDENLKLLIFSSTFYARYLSLSEMFSTNKTMENCSNDIQIPSNIKFIKGNIFNSHKQTIVNTVNCVGVMGKGIALVFKLRYPLMFEIYKRYCDEKQIGIGNLWLYKQQPKTPWVLNFPTKYHWKYPSKIEYIEKGLSKFVETYKEKNITSIAFPLLGTHNGGLDKETVKMLMIKHLSKCEIPIEIYDYDPLAQDDLFLTFKGIWDGLTPQEIQTKSGIQPQYIRKISEILKNPNVYSLVTLASYDGIGEKTLQKAFDFVMNYKQNNIE